MFTRPPTSVSNETLLEIKTNVCAMLCYAPCAASCCVDHAEHDDRPMALRHHVQQTVVSNLFFKYVSLLRSHRSKAYSTIVLQAYLIPLKTSSPACKHWSSVCLMVDSSWRKTTASPSIGS